MVNSTKALAKELAPLLPKEFHRKMLKAAIQSLGDPTNPLALNNFAVSLRELIRNVFTALAPEKEIRGCPWFEPDPSSKTGLTRAQAIRYLVQGGLSDDYVVKFLGIDVVGERRELLKAIDEMSKFTHVEEETFGVDPIKAENFAADALSKLLATLKLNEQCSSRLAHELEEKISDEVIRTVISDSLSEIDVIASHFSLDEVYVDDIEVEHIGSEGISFKVSGSIGVEHQLGSNADARNGDAVNWSESYPFSCDLRSSVESPEELEVEENTLLVDTSSWWEDYSDLGSKDAA